MITLAVKLFEIKLPLNVLLPVTVSVTEPVLNIKLSQYDLLTISLLLIGVVLVEQSTKSQLLKTELFKALKLALLAVIVSASMLFKPSNDWVKL